ncbi:MAG: carboxypeptidase M32 [Bacteroidetes bacterium]|nr:carboxypeptidase M32 [Bacteroidota bacterium]
MNIKKNSSDLYTEYKDITQKAADINNASAVLGWDQEVYMPAKGFEMRGRQLATLASIAHEMLTTDSYGALLHELSSRADLDEKQKANVALSLEDFEKNRKLPGSFVEAMAQQTSKSFNAWIQSRKENKFSVYQTELGKMIDLKKQQADLYGYDKHPYDALVDDYERGATVTLLDSVFDKVKAELPALLGKIEKATQVSDAVFSQHYPRQTQWDFSEEVLRKMGYDFEAGRQDLSEHPFTTSFAPSDVRVTTRVNENDYASLLWSSIHEGGHALYEQGLPEDEYGLPLGAAASLAVHESQSRLWENCVGRGAHFWKYFYPVLQSYFPEQLKGVQMLDFYKGMNKVQPSLIRTEADEITYHFHVLIRYEIEKGLLTGDTKVADLPAVWNGMYDKYLGVSAKDDVTGVLQDVHWSHGMLGYFPTYSLGSFYAAQYYEQAKKDISGLEANMEKGEFSELLQWLRKHIHQYGRQYTSEELCKRVTGKGLDFEVFMNYANNKYKSIYELK